MCFFLLQCRPQADLNLTFTCGKARMNRKICVKLDNCVVHKRSLDPEIGASFTHIYCPNEIDWHLKMPVIYLLRNCSNGIIAKFEQPKSPGPQTRSTWTILLWNWSYLKWIQRLWCNGWFRFSLTCNWLLPKGLNCQLWLTGKVTFGMEMRIISASDGKPRESTSLFLERDEDDKQWEWQSRRLRLRLWWWGWGWCEEAPKRILDSLSRSISRWYEWRRRAAVLMGESSCLRPTFVTHSAGMDGWINGWLVGGMDRWVGERWI